MPKSIKYDTNFTARGLLFVELKAIENILLSSNFNELIKLEQEENKIIKIATKAARKRAIQEIKRRYNKVSKDFWVQFFQWNDNEQKLASLYLCLKTYPIVFDLHFQVTVKKQKLGMELTDYDIQMRLDELASISVDVENWSETTVKKINTQYRTAIKDAGLITKRRLQQPINVNPAFWTYFKENDESWFLEACFI